MSPVNAPGSVAIDSHLLEVIDKLVSADQNGRYFNEEWKSRQYEVTARIEGYTRGDHEYRITASRVLSLARRALEIFKSSEIAEKRQLLGWPASELASGRPKLLLRA